MSKIAKSAKKLSVVLVSAAAVSAVGVAFAAWTSAGVGSGTAKAADSKDSVIAAGTFAADLYPGALKSVTVTVSNPNDYPIVVTQISDGTSAAVGTCAAGSVTATGLGSSTSSTALAQDGSTNTVIAANGSGVYRLQTRMIGDASDGCKSQTFSLPLTARVQSAATTAS
jgi:hypothetical protein